MIAGFLKLKGKSVHIQNKTPPPVQWSAKMVGTDGACDLGGTKKVLEQKT